MLRAGSSSSAKNGRRARRLSWRTQAAGHTVLDRPEGEAPACPLAPAHSCLLLGGAEATAPASLPPAMVTLGDEGLEHQLVVV